MCATRAYLWVLARLIYGSPETNRHVPLVGGNNDTLYEVSILLTERYESKQESRKNSPPTGGNCLYSNLPSLSPWLSFTFQFYDGPPTPLYSWDSNEWNQYKYKHKIRITKKQTWPFTAHEPVHQQKAHLRNIDNIQEGRSWEIWQWSRAQYRSAVEAREQLRSMTRRWGPAKVRPNFIIIKSQAQLRRCWIMLALSEERNGTRRGPQEGSE